VADASPVPLVLYDIPGRTGRRIERATMVSLARHERIVAVKDAVGDPSETALLRADLDAAGLADFEIYSGDDVLVLPQVAAGAVGVVSVCSHLVGERLKEMFVAWNSGNSLEARRIYLDLVPLFSVIMGITTSPIPVKAAIAMLGIEVGSPRLPLVPATDEQVGSIRTAMEQSRVL
jgi:4-hydroxy-tetrahydrodipicolinate synthase